MDATNLTEADIEAAIMKATGKHRTNDSYSFEDVWRCVEAAVAALPSDAAQAPICWITKEQLDQIEDLSADAWVYWRETGHVAEDDEVPLYTAPVAPVTARQDILEEAAMICEQMACGDQFKPEIQDRMLRAAAKKIRSLGESAKHPVAPAAAVPTLLGSPAEGSWGEPETPSDGHRLESNVDECPHGIDDGACKQCYHEKTAQPDERVTHCVNTCNFYVAERACACGLETAPQAKFECAARKQGSVGGNNPADCDWPVCGCDEHANKVIGALEESGALKSTPIYQIGAPGIAGHQVVWWDVTQEEYERQKAAGYMRTGIVYREAM